MSLSSDISLNTVDLLDGKEDDIFSGDSQQPSSMECSASDIIKQFAPGLQIKSNDNDGSKQETDSATSNTHSSRKRYARKQQQSNDALQASLEVGKNSSIDFKQVVKRLNDDGSAKGFRAVRDFLLLQYNHLAKSMGASNVISLAINCDKHAMFADIAAAKSNSKRDVERWKYFQDYMNGAVDTFESPEGVTDENEDELSISISEEGLEDEGSE